MTTFAEERPEIEILCGPEDLDEARRRLAPFLEPAPREELMRELMRLRIRTRSKNPGTDDLAAIAAVYADDLARFPARAALEALEFWGTHKDFWPSMRELLEEVKKRCRDELALAQALGMRP
jgi:hypothetical protein